MFNRIPTWTVADFESILLKEEIVKGENMPGPTVITDRKGSHYDQAFIKVAKSTEYRGRNANFMDKILAIAQLVYHHEQKQKSLRA